MEHRSLSSTPMLVKKKKGEKRAGCEDVRRQRHGVDSFIGLIVSEPTLDCFFFFVCACLSQRGGGRHTVHFFKK
ncbi:hypothetical protein TRSC58_07701 [Trypanosoma rangeli SC58]|uniref:Uncharacterized protein n=1 Tax=Trypanosoma rangeli SC58 TaxID=429131 RepID=A0A061ISN7_TRYRA|nr:hypothetical protein TRSC58_07701 [Trypanosoma rangeli SC58]